MDKREEKALLISEFSQIYKNVKIVAASGISGYKSSNLIKTKRIMKNLYTVGDQIEDDEPYLPARVAIVANHQANMVIRILLGQEEV